MSGQDGWTIMETTLFGVMGLIFVLAMWWKLESGKTRAVDPVLLTGRPITRQEYDALGEIRIELLDGYLVNPETRTQLLRALLANEGLIRVVRLAPPQAWEAALKHNVAGQ